MPALKDRTGQRFGSLTVVGRGEDYVEATRARVRWRCLCDCGRTVDVAATSLASGLTTSCGCGLHRREKQSKDITGLRSGKVLALRFSRRVGRSKSYWLCRCDCGTEKEIEISRMTGGHVQSCGCYHPRLTHGHTANPENKPSITYSSFRSMIDRCCNTSNPAFKHYSKRGISVCDRWRMGEDGLSGFECFLLDVGKRPDTSLTLDRIDNNGNYEPGNVRWATKREQANNRVTNTIVEYRGETMTFSEACRRSGTPKDRARGRLRNGWPTHMIFDAPPERGRRLSCRL